MIKKSNDYSIVCKKTKLVIAKGNKKSMLRIIKENKGLYTLAMTSCPIGGIFAN